MSEWKKKGPNVFEYGDFLINYSEQFQPHRHHMYCTIEFVNDAGNSESKRLDAYGNTFEEVKENIQTKVDNL
ncbi:hypothetical protein [Halalkalibaculum sp. DA384]|uniref:hypothetical protein n=1 Tax=Halalkalibaculum sp. DA384 TaxID=3373606 RepID=UPI0037548A8D